MPGADRDGTAGIRRPAPRAGRPGIAGLCCSAAGLACLLGVGLLGPSVMEPALAGSRREPPYSLHVHPSPYVGIGLTAAGILLAAAGLALCLHAARRGWRTSPRALLIAGAVAAGAFALMPPVGSGDHLNYAAYGRMAATGNDPYATAARRLPADPVIGAVQDWRDAPTVYGPIATAQEAFASLIGGVSVRLTVFVMSVTNAMAFVAVGLLLYLAACGDPDRRLRGALLWSANPLLLFELVGGAHNDVLAIAFAVAGLVVLTLPDPMRPPSAECQRLSRCLTAGALIGVAAAIKINVAIVAGGPAWVLLSEWRRSRGPRSGTAVPSTPTTPTRSSGSAGTRSAGVRLVALAGAALAVCGGSYLMAGPHSVDQLSRASKSVSLATPWHLLAGSTGGLLLTVPRPVVQALALLLAALLAILLFRALPPPPAPIAGGETGDEMLRVGAALALAWLFAAPYALPWYDGLGWATIALLAWSGFDWVLLARTTVLALAYLPARDPRTAGLPHRLDWLVTVVRAQVTPWVLTLTLVGLIVVAIRRSRRVPVPGCSPRAPAGSPQ